MTGSVFNVNPGRGGVPQPIFLRLAG